MDDLRSVPADDEQLLTLHREDGDRSIIVTAAGEVDVLTAPRLQQAVVIALTEAGGRSVVVDLSRVELLSSAGLAALSRAHHIAAVVDGPLRLVVDHARPVIRPLQITGMDHWLELHHTVDEALHQG